MNEAIAKHFFDIYALRAKLSSMIEAGHEADEAWTPFSVPYPSAFCANNRRILQRLCDVSMALRESAGKAFDEAGVITADGYPLTEHEMATVAICGVGGKAGHREAAAAALALQSMTLSLTRELVNTGWFADTRAPNQRREAQDIIDAIIAETNEDAANRILVMANERDTLRTLLTKLQCDETISVEAKAAARGMETIVSRITSVLPGGDTTRANADEIVACARQIMRGVTLPQEACDRGKWHQIPALSLNLIDHMAFACVPPGQTDDIRAIQAITDTARQHLRTIDAELAPRDKRASIIVAPAVGL